MGQKERQKLERLQVPEIGEILEGRYRVQGVIATGGMGVILRAEQLPMERPVALKLLHPHIAVANPKLVERFAREVRLAKQLNHPNTIRLYDFGKTERGLVYVAMEMLEGMDLKRRLAREGPMSVGRAIETTRQILDGLAEAHARGFIHRDLKPSNVFIVKNRRGEDLVKLLDFGIAKSLSDSVELTGSGSICGTPSYVAPEYLMQERPGKPADIYAVGLILLEMLTGREVFRGEAPVQTMMMHLKLDPEIPDEIARTPLAKVIERATAKDPRERYGDAEEMYEAVCDVMHRVPGDLIVQRPSHNLLPDVTEAGGEGLDSAQHERAAVDTIVPELPEELDSSDELAPMQSTPSWIERAVPAQVFRRELERQLAQEAGAESGSAESQAEGCAPTEGETPAMFFWTGAAITAVALLGAVIFWLIDPGAAPGLDDATIEPARPSAPVEPAQVDEPSVPDVQQQATPAARRVSFDIDSEPVGAVVFVGEQAMGRTPLTHRVAEDELPQTVRLELDGYEPAEVELTRTTSPIVVEILDEQAGEASPAVSTEPLRGRSGKGARPVDAEDRDGDNNAMGDLSNERIEAVMDEYLRD